MDKIGFVILHYIVKDETIKCVESIIEKIDTKNYEIIIVDNASVNNSGIELKELYKNNSKIHVILNEKNLGFTGGNNIGFKYAKDLNCNFICMMNNDTYLIQDDFFKQIEMEYNNSHCAVIGPEIHLLNGAIELVNKKLISKEELLQQIKRCKKSLIKNYLFIESLDLTLRKYIKKVIGYKKDNNYRLNNPIEKRQEDVVLHGCCLIFTPIYIDKFDGLNHKTFLYKEEELLYVRLKQNNMLPVYNPDIKIFHTEDVATNSETKKSYKKRRFVYKYNIKACYALLEEMER